VNPSVLFSPTNLIAVTDGINPSVKLDNVVVNVMQITGSGEAGKVSTTL
jgi:hypothetical protein